MNNKELKLLKDVVRSTKAIRKNNFLPKSEVDQHLGFDGICVAIEDATLRYKPAWDISYATVTLPQFISYIVFIQANIAPYNCVEDVEENNRKSKEWQSTVISDFYDTLDRILKNDITKPKFV